MHALLDPILRHERRGHGASTAPGRRTRLVAGDTLRLPDLADTLEAIARRGPAASTGRARARDRRDRARRRAAS